MIILRLLLLLTNLHLKLLSTQGTGADKLLSTQRVNSLSATDDTGRHPPSFRPYEHKDVDWRQCGNSLALCYFAVVMELPDSLLMNCKSEFGVIFLRCSPT